MHIVLGALGSIVTILYFLHRLALMGIDLGGFNPFLWQRRRAWRKKFEGNPIFSLEDPMDVAGLLAAGVAKIDGDMSGDEKRALLAEFQSTFSLTGRDASGLLISSVHLLKDPHILLSQLDDVLAKSKDRLTPAQLDSLLSLLERIAKVDGPATTHQRELISGVRSRLAPQAQAQGTWG